MTASPQRVEPTSYRIRVNGRLDDHWLAWFDGLTLTYSSDGTTTLTGPIPDQAALHGLLTKIRDLGLVLVSIKQAGP